MTVWKKRDEFRPGTNFSAWVFRIARFKALSFCRDIGREKLSFLGGDIEEEIEQFGSALAHETSERLDILRECIEELNETERTLLQARYERGETIAGVAETLEMSEDAAYQAISRLRKRLKKKFEDRLRDQEN
ncbi:MAG: sigma-70 family RNA polymerase sigma factor [Verrucomicrobiae bacterium]|nr:sigma-70 family RNA polymerase sigma factor [Verrucomicrobiae bacterium]